MGLRGVKDLLLVDVKSAGVAAGVFVSRSDFVVLVFVVRVDGFVCVNEQRTRRMSAESGLSLKGLALDFGL